MKHLFSQRRKNLILIYIFISFKLKTFVITGGDQEFSDSQNYIMEFLINYWKRPLSEKIMEFFNQQMEMWENPKYQEYMERIRPWLKKYD